MGRKVTVNVTVRRTRHLVWTASCLVPLSHEWSSQRVSHVPLQQVIGGEGFLQLKVLACDVGLAHKSSLVGDWLVSRESLSSLVSGHRGTGPTSALRILVWLTVNEEIDPASRQ